MQKLKSTSGTDAGKGEVFFRIMPMSIKKNGNVPGCLTSKWLLYLEKGRPHSSFRHANLRQNERIRNRSSQGRTQIRPL